MKRPLIAAGFLCLALSPLVVAANPGWWTESSTQVIDPAASHAVSENYAPANLGQLKNMAKKAKLHLDTTLGYGAGEPIDLMVAGFGVQSTTVDNYAPVNIGQVKAVSEKFYDRLIRAGYDTKANLIAHGYPNNWQYKYPWNNIVPVSTEENYAPANIGQLKAVFSFDATGLDSDMDGLPGWWEVLNGLNPNDPADALTDLDNDRINNLDEFLEGLNPNVYEIRPPAGLLAFPKVDSITISWSQVPGSTTYLVKRSQQHGGPYTLIGTVNSLRYVDLNVSVGQTYYYVLISTDGTIQSAASDEVSATPHPALAEPVNVIATPGDSLVSLVWTNSSLADSYTVKRSENLCGPFVNIVANTDQASFTDYDVINGHTYFYIVNVVQNGLVGAASEAVSAVPVAAIVSPPLWVSSVAYNSSIQLSWEAGQGSRTYAVKRSLVSGGPFQLVADNLVKPEFHDAGLVNGTSYYYVVTARLNQSESLPSEEISETPLQTYVVKVPDAPSNFRVIKQEDGSTKYQWEDNSNNEEQFIITRYDANGNPMTVGIVPANVNTLIIPAP